MTPPGWRFLSESTSMERLDGETILIDFASGSFFSFRGPAADIAWLIEHGVARDRWPAFLADVFPDFPDDPEVAAEIDGFVAQLETVGLITPLDAAGVVDGSPELRLPDDYQRTAWQAPLVAVNDSLSDLLAIDPIHDVSDDGWPQTNDR